MVARRTLAALYCLLARSCLDEEPDEVTEVVVHEAGDFAIQRQIAVRSNYRCACHAPRLPLRAFTSKRRM